MCHQCLKRWSLTFGLAFIIPILFFSPAGASSDLLVESIPSGAKIFINDAYYGKTPTTVELSAGKYRLELELEGYRKYGDKISILPNRHHRIHAGMVMARGYGKLVIASDPSSAALFINDRYHDQTPVEIILRPGRYNIRIERKGYAPYIDEVSVKERRTLQITAPLAAKKRFGSLIIDSEPPGAQVFIRSRYYDVTPARIELRGGDYQVRVEKEGYEPQVKTVSVGRHRKARVSFVLEPIVRHGVVRLTSVPARCKVFIDGKFYSKTPISVRLPTGRHELKLTKKGFRSYLESIHIRGGEEIENEIVLAGRAVPSRRKGTLRVNSVPSGAQAKIDGRPSGVTPFEVELSAGRHEIFLDKPGHNYSIHQVEVRGGELDVVWLHMRHVDPRLFLGELHLVSNPTSQVIIDGSDYGRTPLVVQIPTGAHTLEIKAEGYRPYREDFSVAVGQVLHRKIQLEGKRRHRPVQVTGRIDIVSQPLSAKVFIDQKYAGQTPLTLDLDPGTYFFELRHRGYIPYRQDVRIRPGDNSPLKARLRWQGHSRPAWDLKDVIEGIFRED